MPAALVHGVHLSYQVLGDKGPWIALSPGGRRPCEEMAPFAQRLAEGGYRVLLHDRRNCGDSDVSFDGEGSETEIWADDLHELLRQLDALPAFIGGTSSGCRLALIFAIRHPRAVRGLMLWRISGGQFAAAQLAETYYGQYATAARQGGMAAICATPHFQERIEARPVNRERLMAMEPTRFIALMEKWHHDFIEGGSLPLIGVTEAELRGITAPVCLVPGNDKVHSTQTGLAVAGLLPHVEIHDMVPRLAPEDSLEETGPELWKSKEEALASLFIDFAHRCEAAR